MSGSGTRGHSGALFPQTEIAASSAFRIGQFSGYRAKPQSQHGAVMVTSTQEGCGGDGSHV